MNYWLVKSEPFKYAWDTLEREGRTAWDGVRNYQARNALAAMQPGDLVLFYHSNAGKAVVGIARVATAAYPDPTAPGDPRWLVVDLVPVQRLVTPVTLERIKADPQLQQVGLLRQPRLSVMPLQAEAFDRICALGS